MSPGTKLNSNWIKDINKKIDTLNMREGEVENNLELTNTGRDILKRMQLALSLGAKINT